MKTVAELIRGNVNRLYVPKKNGKFIRIKNGELALTSSMMESIASESSTDLASWMSNMLYDDRNLDLIGDSYNIVELNRKN